MICLHNVAHLVVFTMTKLVVSCRERSSITLLVVLLTIPRRILKPRDAAEHCGAHTFGTQIPRSFDRTLRVCVNKYFTFAQVFVSSATDATPYKLRFIFVKNRVVCRHPHGSLSLGLFCSKIVSIRTIVMIWFVHLT